MKPEKVILDVYRMARRNGLNDGRARFHAARKAKEIAAPAQTLELALEMAEGEHDE